MPHDDLDYFRNRIDRELRQERRANCPEAANVHRQLAAAYRRRLTGRDDLWQPDHG